MYIAVPANNTSGQLEELKNFKPEVTYILRRIAKMHVGQHLNIGQLDKQMVLEVEKLAKNTGFSLASFKIKNSI